MLGRASHLIFPNSFNTFNIDATVSIGPSLCSVTDGPTSYQTKVDINILYFYEKERSKLGF